MSVRVAPEDIRYIQSILGRCLDEYQYQPDIGFGEHELATEIRIAMDILSEYEDDQDEEEVEELDFN